MTYRMDGDGGGGPASHASTADWHRQRRAAMAVEQAAREVRLPSASVTVLGADKLIDALDIYWQVRFGGRVMIVSGPEQDR